jgi:hypothetical protein
VLLRTIGDQHQRHAPRHDSEEVSQHRLADLVDPMDVIDDEQRRLRTREGGRVDQRRQPTPARVGIDVGRLDARLVNAQEVVDQQQILGIGVGLSVATLLAGSRVKPAAAARLLDEVITPNALNQRLWVLSSSDYWRSICAALIRLSDYLNNYGGDVDYRRRRHLNYSELLPEDAWQQVCARAGGPVQTPRTALAPRCYLIEKLIGTPAQGLRSLNGELDERGMLTLVNDFRRSLTAELEHLLHDRAQRFLELHNINEPVTWHPPLAA